jgi:hypothetical protein
MRESLPPLAIFAELLQFYLFSMSARLPFRKYSLYPCSFRLFCLLSLALTNQRELSQHQFFIHSKMRSTALVALFFASALAMPQVASEASSSSSSTSESSDSDSSDFSDIVPSYSLPSDYMSILETAVPSSWEYEMENTASAAAVISAAAAGTYPAWYNDLPASIKAVVTSLGGFDANIVGETGSVTAVATPNSSAPATETAAATTTSDTTVSPVTETQASGTSSAASGTKSAASTSADSTSAHSTGGAPVATGSVAMSVAGAAGLVGLALAL